MIVLWLQFILFILCSAIIVFCGTKLARYGDVIAEKTGLGRAWIGLVLMASVTSLPELITGISSVTIANTPDIALGDVMGSCVFNLFIIAIMDALNGKDPIFIKAGKGHILSAGLGIILIGIASVSILANPHIPALGHIGLYTLVIIFVYCIGIRNVFMFEKREIARFINKISQSTQYDKISMKTAAIIYALNAVIVVIVAAYLPFIGDRLALETGLGRSFIGTVFIALTTSLPEVVVSISALKIGAIDMAIANLFGSNMFNIFILAIDDIFYTDGALLSSVSMSHAVTGFMAVIMTGIAIAGLTYRIEKKTFLRLGWDAIAILLAYIINIYLLYSLRGEG